MGHRLSKIATRTGDDGSTGLGDGSRTGKDSVRIQALGDVDELNSQVGVLLCEDLRRHSRKSCCRSSMICSISAANCAFPATP